MSESIKKKGMICNVKGFWEVKKNTDDKGRGYLIIQVDPCKCSRMIFLKSYWLLRRILKFIRYCIERLKTALSKNFEKLGSIEISQPLVTLSHSFDWTACPSTSSLPVRFTRSLRASKALLPFTKQACPVLVLNNKIAEGSRARHQFNLLIIFMTLFWNKKHALNRKKWKKSQLRLVLILSVFWHIDYTTKREKKKDN